MQKFCWGIFVLIGVLGLSCSTFVTAAAKSKEIHLLNEWLQKQDYQEKLSTILYHCYYTGNDEVSISEEECNVAHYLHHYHAQQQTSTTSANGGTSSGRTLKVDTIPLDTPYPTIFEDYILKSR